MRFNSLIDAARDSLNQELEILLALTSAGYRAPSIGPFSSSVGMHLRHNLDHYEAFFSGLDKAEIDYETRGRNTMIEESREVAIEALEVYLGHLEQLRLCDDISIRVREESDASAHEGVWVISSLGRELQFLIGHTVHHNAIIAMIVHGNGLELPSSFGLAPSTRRYQEGDGSVLS